MRVAVALVIAASSVVHAATPSVRDVAWLAGCWETTPNNGRLVEEQWTAPRGGTMLGVGRTTAGGMTLDHEFVVIRVDGRGTLAYEAHPDGQTPTTFRATEVSSSRVVFEDPTHDFPQQVGYELTAPDRLMAWVGGRSGGEVRRIPFAYHRVACATDTAS